MYSNKNIAPSSSIWENRAIDLSPPVCSVSRRGISFILSGKTHLLPFSLNMFSSMSPLVDLSFSFPQMPMLGQCASSVGGPYANDNSNNYLAEGKDPLLSEGTLRKEWEMYVVKIYIFLLDSRLKDAVIPDRPCVSESNNIIVSPGLL